MVNKLQRVKEWADKCQSISKGYIEKTKEFYFDKEIDKKVNLFLKNGLTLKQTIITASVLVIAIIIILVPQPQSMKSPIGVIKNIQISLNKSDLEGIANLVDIKALTNQISSNLLSTEKKALNKELLATVKSEFDRKIMQDFYNIVQEKGDYSKNIHNKNAVLSKILNVIFGKNGAIMGMTVIEENSDSAKVSINVFRADLNKDINIVLKLEKSSSGTWKITKIDNIKELLEKLNKFEEEKLSNLNSNKNNDLSKFIYLKAFKIDNIDIKNNTLIFRTSLENTSRHTLENIKGKIYIMYNENTIGSIDVSISDKIRPFSFFEKAWSIKLEKNNLLLRNIAKVRPDNLSADIEVKSAYFSSDKTNM